MNSDEDSVPHSRPFWPFILAISLLSGALDVFVSTFRTIWSDEAFTAIASTLGIHRFWHLIATRQDAVNATYDFIVRPFILTFGHGATALRFPSAVFMALACAGVMTIARSLVGARVATSTGLIFAVMPLATGYGTEARSYALSAAVVTWSTWLALRALYDRHSLRRWAWLYGLSLVVVAYVFLYALAIIIVHFVVAKLNRVERARLRHLLFAQGFAVVATIPLALVAWREHGETSWIPHGLKVMLYNGAGIFATPFWSGMAATPFPEFLGLVAWSVIFLGIWRLRTRSQLSGETRIAVSLALAWAIIPGALLSLASAFGPYFTLRYIVFCVPATALLLGIAFNELRGILTRVALVIALVSLIAFADAPLFSRAGKDGWGSTLATLSRHGSRGNYVFPSPQSFGTGTLLDARVTGLPHSMTLIDFGRTLPWTPIFKVSRWSSSSAPPTPVIWLVSRFGAINCSSLATLHRWGFTVRKRYGPSGSPSYEFVHSRPAKSTSVSISCTRG